MATTQDRTAHQKAMTLLYDTWGVVEGIYDNSDGYGEPGYIPIQGHDWSGIRDSSDGAVARMFSALLQELAFSAPPDGMVLRRSGRNVARVHGWRDDGMACDSLEFRLAQDRTLWEAFVALHGLPEGEVLHHLIHRAPMTPLVTLQDLGGSTG